MRQVINFNENWYFSKTSECPESLPMDWEAVTLPHTWNAVDGQDGGNDYYRGTCTYAKKLPEPRLNPGDRAILEFNGAAMTAEVYINGEKLCRHEGGYSTFRTDITDSLREGQEDNLLCVTVDNSVNDRVYPQKADFTFYGGLYRSVNLLLVSEQHFELIKDGTPGIKVTPKVELTGENTGRAAVVLESWQSAGDKVRFTITDGEGREAVWKEAAVTDGYARAEAMLKEVHLWNGTADPYLYGIRAELIADGEVKDCVQTRFGCRTFSFDREQGFFLNGKAYPLRGVSRHQDRMGVGNALTREMHREDMEIIREIGANTVRLAHYQHAQEFYNLADEYGMVVWAEIPYITQHMPKGKENTLSQMRELVTQCHHHPSIVCWGLSNEITASSPVTEDMMENHRLLNELCHQMDETRPTAMAHAFMLETENLIIGIPDICSYNLYFGWYLGELEQNDRFFDEFHEKYPERIIGFSEYGADANLQFQTAVPELGDYTEQYQAVYHEHLLNCIEERPYIWAAHVWNMFDFAADGRDEGGAHGRNQKGLVTMDRKQRKDAFYLYKAAWSGEPFVHLCGSRYVERTEDAADIKVYSNLAEVSLYMDGTFVETMRGERIFRFRVSITGEHRIEARSGTCTDMIKIRKVEHANPDYQFQKETITNWFDKEEMNPDCFSIQDTMGEVMANPKGAAILGKLIDQASASRGEVAQSTKGNENLQRMMAGMKIQALLKQAGEAISPEQVKTLNKALQQIKKQEGVSL